MFKIPTLGKGKLFFSDQKRNKPFAQDQDSNKKETKMLNQSDKLGGNASADLMNVKY